MKNLLRIVFALLVTELIIGGGGRLFVMGPVTMRMVLFAVAMSLTILCIKKGRRLPAPLSTFLLVFLGSLAVALTIGIISGAPLNLWFEDIKPLLYVLILPFFFFVFEDNDYEQFVSKIIITAALAMSFVFFLVLFAIHVGLIPFLSFYDSVIGSQEFFFRAETTFFYKGFIYLCIGLLFLYFTRPKQWILLSTILAIAIVLTFTRGFIFALAGTSLLYAILNRKYYQAVGSVLVMAATLIIAKPVIYTVSETLHTVKAMDASIPKEKLLGNRDESDQGRLLEAKQVVKAITPTSFFVGHGFGNGVASRPVHMEVSYLEIFHKQGIVGLAVWLYLFFLLIKFYQHSRGNRYSVAYFYSATFLFIQSLTNQFINNPIGLSFILLSLVILHKISKSSEQTTRLPKKSLVTKKVMDFQ